MTAGAQDPETTGAPAAAAPGLVDVHAHFVTGRYAAEARAAGHVRPDVMPGWPEWSVERQLALMDRAGIARAYLSVSSPGTHFGDDRAARTLTREMNDFGAATRREHPTRFGHFASLPLPDVGGSVEEAARALDRLGADGLAVETNAHGVYLGDPRFEPLWRELDRRRATVFVHPTSPPHAEEVACGLPRPVAEFLFDTARAVSTLVFNGVLLRFPHIRWIFTHGGGVLPLLADRMEMFRAGGIVAGAPSVPVHEQLRELWFDTAGTPFPRQVPALTALFGTERLLYGSDSCWTPDAGVLAQVASIDAAPQPAPDTWRSLTARNAGRLLGAGSDTRRAVAGTTLPATGPVNTPRL
ncbi:amidohydrolase family protein [Streptomyces sp. NPDC090306]|uniref:amidohydrolase family protein n=1 Tax=Streptomyces sp. NPDC090306 TaxID=3365961 RepID=UPI0038060232